MIKNDVEKSTKMREICVTSIFSILFQSLLVIGHCSNTRDRHCSIAQLNSTKLIMSCEESNPSSNSNICGACDHAVSWSQRGVACETCGRWYHASCQSINSNSYENLGNSDVLWFCDLCGNNNYSTTFFDLHGTESELHNLGDSDISINSDFRPYHSSTPSRQGQQNKFRSRPLRLLNVNFQSIVSKRAETLELLERLKPDVLIGTETWLRADIKDSEILTHHYTIYRKDRKEGNRGGVLIAVKNDLQSMRLDNLDSDCESIWVKILTRTLKPIFIGGFYRRDTKDIKSLTTFQASLRKVCEMKNSQVIVAGDFNLPSWDWSSMTIKDNPRYKQSHIDFIELLADLSVQQMVLEPTRLTNTLDLVLTNAPDLVPRVEVIPGLSDHNIVFFEFSVKADRKKNALRQIFLYKKADWEAIKSEMEQLERQIKEMIDSGEKSMDEIWEHFKETLLDSMTKNIPKKATRPRDSYPWITVEIKKLIKKRDRLSKKRKKRPSDELDTKYRDVRNEVKRLIRKEYWNYVCNLFEENEKDLDSRPCMKRFWTYMKHQRSTTTGVSPLRSEGKLVTDPKAKAEILNNQFYKAFSEGKTYSERDFTEKCNMETNNNMYDEMDNIIITDKGIEKLLANLNPAKATGPDGLPPRVLKELSKELAPIFGMIFRLSLSTGAVPSDWRHALVTPIFKKGEQYDPINYRPVSLTSIPCKLLEHIIVSNLMQHLEDNNILNERQHGFRKGRSCETQLLEFVEEVTTGLDEGLPTDVIIMDFAKAFDKVNHSLLTHKLAHYGVRGSTNLWIQNFLKDRTQAVVVEGEKSDLVDVRSGVPQGSVLGPCLFLAYINDLPDRVTATSRLFADDTLIQKLIENENDRNNVQKDLEQLEKWEGQWDMNFHPEKCNVLPVERSNNTKDNTSETEYFLHGHKLEKVTNAKYLGVTLQSNMKFNVHIDNICTKANKMLGMLRRNLRSAPEKTKELGYKSLVRPVLEYASSVWDPHTAKDIGKIEAVQRRAARFIKSKYKKEDSVSAMIKDLEWNTLEQRRRKARLSMLYKIRHDQVQVKFVKLKRLKSRGGRRGHTEQYERVTCKSEYRNQTFLPKTVREWNSLDQETVNAQTVATFSSRVAKLF